MYHCPGCKCAHGLWIRPQMDRPLWSWNGSFVRPTFSPSVLVREGDKTVCHSFVRDGQIEFLSDCTHALAGKTVPMEAL